jgi:error-prone DNA polymerase
MRRGTLEQLAWSGACDGLAGAELAGAGDRARRMRRTALWQAGVAATAAARDDGAEQPVTQLALPVELPPAPELRPLGRWQRMIADYATSGVSTGEHAIAILRPRLTVPMLATSAQLTRLPSGGDVAVAGLVIARQRPGTAKGTMFLLFEDEFGTVNLIVPLAVYERHRQLARAEPLLLARGRLERTQEQTLDTARRARAARAAADPRGEPPEEIRPVINVLVRELAPLERFLPGGVDEELGGDAQATLHRLPAPAHAHGADDGGEEDVEGAEVGSSMRAVAPPIQSFAAGRRR